jgi:hypothetical protein
VEGFAAPNVINAEKISELQQFSGVYSGKMWDTGTFCKPVKRAVFMIATM